MDDDFGVGMGSEPVAAAFELGAQRRKVVDLAVEDDPHRAVLVRQRLLPRGDVDDAQPAVAEPDAVAEEEAVGIGPAMRDAVASSRESSPGPRDDALKERFAGETAHDCRTRSQEAASSWSGWATNCPPAKLGQVKVLEAGTMRSNENRVPPAPAPRDRDRTRTADGSSD